MKQEQFFIHVQQSKMCFILMQEMLETGVWNNSNTGSGRRFTASLRKQNIYQLGDNNNKFLVSKGLHPYS